MYLHPQKVSIIEDAARLSASSTSNHLLALTTVQEASGASFIGTVAFARTALEITLTPP